MFFNSNLKYYRWNKELFIKDSYTKEELEFLYENIIIYNLSKITEVPYSEFIWRDVSELTVTGKGLVENFTLNTHNSFLKDATDRTLLGKELKEIGFYLPVFTSIDEKGQIEVDSGKHRITSIKLIKEEGLWDNRPVLTVQTKEVNVKHTETIDGFLPDLLPQEVTLRIPIFLLFSINYHKLSESQIDDALKTINAHTISKDIVEMKTIDTKEFYRCLMFTGYWIAEMFHAYKTYTGDTIIGSPIINSKEYFEEWIKGDRDE